MFLLESYSIIIPQVTTLAIGHLYFPDHRLRDLKKNAKLAWGPMEGHSIRNGDDFNPLNFV